MAKAELHCREKFPYEAEITIYGVNKVSITKLGTQNIIGVIIEDMVVHNMMKMIFELCWSGNGLRTQKSLNNECRLFHVKI